MFGFVKKILIGLFSSLTTRRFSESVDSNSKGRIKRLSLNN